MLELGYGVPCHYKHQLNGTKQQQQQQQQKKKLMNLH